MQCPHCKYEHGWSGDDHQEIKGEKGGFFELPIKAEKYSIFDYNTQRETVYACPSCGILFIDV